MFFVLNLRRKFEKKYFSSFGFLNDAILPIRRSEPLEATIRISPELRRYLS